MHHILWQDCFCNPVEDAPFEEHRNQFLLHMQAKIPNKKLAVMEDRMIVYMIEEESWAWDSSIKI